MSNTLRLRLILLKLLRYLLSLYEYIIIWIVLYFALQNVTNGYYIGRGLSKRVIGTHFRIVRYVWRTTRSPRGARQPYSSSHNQPQRFDEVSQYSIFIELRFKITVTVISKSKYNNYYITLLYYRTPRSSIRAWMDAAAELPDSEVFGGISPRKIRSQHSSPLRHG
jgi:hypothetical protein